MTCVFRLATGKWSERSESIRKELGWPSLVDRRKVQKLCLSSSQPPASSKTSQSTCLMQTPSYSAERRWNPTAANNLFSWAPCPCGMTFQRSVAQEAVLAFKKQLKQHLL